MYLTGEKFVVFKFIVSDALVCSMGYLKLTYLFIIFCQNVLNNSA